MLVKESRSFLMCRAFSQCWAKIARSVRFSDGVNGVSFPLIIQPGQLEEQFLELLVIIVLLHPTLRFSERFDRQLQFVPPRPDRPGQFLVLRAAYQMKLMGSQTVRRGALFCPFHGAD